MPRIWSKGAASSGGGETYKAGEGLEETGSKPVTFKVKALGIVSGMLAAAAVTAEKLAANSVETAKIKAEAVTNEKIAAAAGIEDSKLALTTVVKLAGSQTITGSKTFNPTVFTAAPIRVFAAVAPEITAAGNITAIEAPFNEFTLNGTENALSIKKASGSVIFLKNPNSGAMVYLLRNSIEVQSKGNLTLAPLFAVDNQVALQPEGGSTTTGWVPTAIRHLPSLLAVEEGTATGESRGMVVGLKVGAGWTVPHRGLVMQNAVGTGTVSESAAVYVEDLKKGAVNYSVNSLGEAVKLKNAGPVEMGKGHGAWKTAPPAAQHARIAKVEPLGVGALLLAVIERLNENTARLDEVTQEVLPEYGLTK